MAFENIMLFLEDVFQNTDLSNPLHRIFLAIFVFIGSIAVLKIFKNVIVYRLKQFAKKTVNDLDDLLVDLIDHIGWSFYFLLSLYLSFFFLRLPAYVSKTVLYLFLIVTTYYVVAGVQKVVDYGAGKLIHAKRIDESDKESIHFLSIIVKVVLWVGAFVLILSNLGYDVSTLVAGLGISGIAIAFALQNILGDIFASFSIHFDKPFKVGDFIIIGSDMGVVKKIGIKSTRISTLQGQELVVSNKELTETRVHNYKKMRKRRVVFGFGITYGSKSAKMKKIPGIISEIVKKIKQADLDRAHFKDFGDFSLNYEVVYYVTNGDYNTFMDIQQEINLKIKEAFEKEKIEMAFPTQTLYIEK